jgi:hypothetical protein
MFFSIYLLAITTIFVLISYLVILKLDKTATEKLKICSFELKNEATTSYLISYVLPFMSFPIQGEWNQIAAFSIFFIVLGYLYINSNMIFINPLLSLAGFHIFNVTNDKGDTYVVLTREYFRKGMIIDAVSMGDKMYYCKSKGIGDSE